MSRDDEPEIKYDPWVYVIPRIIVSFSLIPEIFLLGHWLKRFKNAENYTALILFFMSWCYLNAFDVLIY
jgi:hypothetical protein